MRFLIDSTETLPVLKVQMVESLLDVDIERPIAFGEGFCFRFWKAKLQIEKCSGRKCGSGLARAASTLKRSGIERKVSREKSQTKDLVRVVPGSHQTGKRLQFKSTYFRSGFTIIV